MQVSHHWKHALMAFPNWYDEACHVAQWTIMQKKRRRKPYLGNQLRPRCSVLEKRILSCKSYSGLQFNSRSSLDSNSFFLLEENNMQQDRIYELWEMSLKPTELMWGLNGSNGVPLHNQWSIVSPKTALISPSLFSLFVFSWCIVVPPAYIRKMI